MTLTDLPVEILVVIIKKLDTKSVHSLYETCSRLKNVICMHNVVKTADLALSTMATVNFLKQSFMKDISRHLQTLDLRGIGDLNLTALLAAVGPMKCLNTLDVSYTNITILDFYEVYKLCPTIKNVACNFVFGTKRDVKAAVLECQGLFQNFDRVHFVGNAPNLFYTSLGVWMLHKANLTQLQLTVVENCGTVYDPVQEAKDRNVKVKSKFISICILNEWNIPLFCGDTLSLPRLLHLEEKHYEYVVVKTEDYFKSQLYATPMLMKFLHSYNVKGIKHLNISKYVMNGVIMFWDRSQTEFNDVFFQELKTKMHFFFPHNIMDNTAVVPKEHDKCVINIPSGEIKSVVATDTISFKRRRQAPQCHTLDYDAAFSTHEAVHLSMFFPRGIKYPVTLSTTSQYLRKLRSLYMTGSVRYSSEFFNVLFRCCEQLETLNVENSPHSPNSSVVARNIPLSRSLKNLRLVDRKIDFATLFSSLSQCSTLENIHIVDSSQDLNTLGDPRALVERCRNLYCISICVVMSFAARMRTNRLFKKLKCTYGKYHLHVELDVGYPDVRYNYDPYCHVFNVNPMKPLERLY